MKARIVDLKYIDRGKVLTVEVSMPTPPDYPKRGLDTDDEVAKFREADRTYRNRLRDYENLHLGEIEFEYGE